MDLDDVLDAFDRTSANIAKLETILERAEALMPTGPQLGSDAEYDDLSRAWRDLTQALPPIDGFDIADEELPSIEDLGQGFIDYLEIGEPPTRVWEHRERPRRQLAEYRYRLGRARRRAVRRRLEQLVADVEQTLDDIDPLTERGEHDSSGAIRAAEAEQLGRLLAEIERLMGDSVERQGRWNDLHRHLRLAHPHDWEDIQTQDWPSVLEDIRAAGFAETDPLPVEGIDDLGAAASDELHGSATTALKWDD